MFFNHSKDRISEIIQDADSAAIEVLREIQKHLKELNKTGKSHFIAQIKKHIKNL